MSQVNIENVEKVRALVFADSSLSSRVQAGKDETGMVAALIAIGAEKNLPITPADVEAWRASESARHQLSDDQLADVAGGVTLQTSSPVVSGGLTAPSLGPKGGQINPVPTSSKPSSGYVSYGDSILCGFCSGATYS